MQLQQASALVSARREARVKESVRRTLLAWGTAVLTILKISAKKDSQRKNRVNIGHVVIRVIAKTLAFVQ